VHRCYIVANSQVERIDRNTLYIQQAAISIGSAYADAVSRILNGEGA
jgi:two-component system LytT family response regulator